VPGDALAVAWHFAEEVRAPTDDVLAQQVAGDSHDPSIGQYVVDPAVAEMGGGDGLAVSAGGERARERLGGNVPRAPQLGGRFAPDRIVA